jgi:hypothetical protein
MTRRRLLVFGLLVSMLALRAGVLVLRPRTAITRENAAKVRVGLTLEEVYKILGGRERDERTGAIYPDIETCDDCVGAPVEFLFSSGQRDNIEVHRIRMNRFWSSDSVIFGVYVNSDNRVAATFSVYVHRTGADASLRRWLGL